MSTTAPRTTTTAPPVASATTVALDAAETATPSGAPTSPEPSASSAETAAPSPPVPQLNETIAASDAAALCPIAVAMADRWFTNEDECTPKASELPDLWFLTLHGDQTYLTFLVQQLKGERWRFIAKLPTTTESSREYMSYLDDERLAHHVIGPRELTVLTFAEDLTQYDCPDHNNCHDVRETRTEHCVICEAGADGVLNCRPDLIVREKAKHENYDDANTQKTPPRVVSQHDHRFDVAIDADGNISVEPSTRRRRPRPDDICHPPPPPKPRRATAAASLVDGT